MTEGFGSVRKKVVPRALLFPTKIVLVPKGSIYQKRLTNFVARLRKVGNLYYNLKRDWL